MGLLLTAEKESEKMKLGLRMKNRAARKRTVTGQHLTAKSMSISELLESEGAQTQHMSEEKNRTPQNRVQNIFSLKYKQDSPLKHEGHPTFSLI
jgi:hypothetical protein